MNTKAIGLGIVIVAVAVIALILFAANAFADPYWESDGFEEKTETGELIGTWGQEIYLEYADGTMQSLKLLCENREQSVWHQGNEIIGVYYKLNGKASAVGYTSCTVRLRGMDVRVEARQGSVVKHGVTKDLWAEWQDDVNLPLDDVWHQLGQTHFSALVNDPAGIVYNLPPGTYTIYFIAQGSLQYNADGGEWQPATLPATISFVVEVQQDNMLTISFSAGYHVQGPP